MASLTDAYARVQAQTLENNAAAEEDGGAMQEVFTGILDTLSKDLDPKNVEEPLSDYGKIIDWLVPFKQKQIEAEADRQAGIAEIKFGAGTNLRGYIAAERLKFSLEAKVAENKERALSTFGQDRATFDATDSVKDFMFAAVNKSPGLATTFSSFNKKDNRHLFKVFNKGDIAGIQAGQLVYTDEATGKKLYATADDDAKNLNYHHAKISTDMAANLKRRNFSISDIRKSYSSVEGRKTLFADKDFKEAVQETLEGVPNEILISHKIYQKALKKRMEQIDKRLNDRSRITSANIRKADLAILQYSKDNKAFLLAGGDRRELDRLVAERALYKIEELKTSLDGSFQTLFQAKVNEKAFVLSLLKGQKVEASRADINIDQAIRLVMADDDESLRKYKKDLEYFYGIESKKIRGGGAGAATDPAAPSAARIAPKNGSPAVARSYRVKEKAD